MYIWMALFRYSSMPTDLCSKCTYLCSGGKHLFWMCWCHQIWVMMTISCAPFPNSTRRNMNQKFFNTGVCWAWICFMSENRLPTGKNVNKRIEFSGSDISQAFRIPHEIKSSRQMQTVHTLILNLPCLRLHHTITHIDDYFSCKFSI